MGSTSFWTVRKSAASHPASAMPLWLPPSCSTLVMSLTKDLSSSTDSGRILYALNSVVTVELLTVEINLMFLCCRSVISYKADQKPLFSTDIVANSGSLFWVYSFQVSQSEMLIVCSVQRTWASMMTLMLMCWGTIRSLLWSTSSTWPWGSPPPASRVPGWPPWTAPARMPVSSSLWNNRWWQEVNQM